MKTVAATEAKNRLGAILDEAQREPIVIRRQDRDIAVVLSMADYERLTKDVKEGDRLTVLLQRGPMSLYVAFTISRG